MLKKIFLLIPLIFLTSCQTYQFSDDQPELSFVHLEPIFVEVHHVNIINNYTKSSNYKSNQTYILNDSPRETLENLINSKIIPTIKSPSNSAINFYIIDAKITQTDYKNKSLFEGILKVHVEVLSVEKHVTSFKDFEIYVVKDTALGITLVQKDDAVFALNEQLMQKFYTAFLKYKKVNLSML